PNDVAIDILGNIYVADYDNQRIRKISTDGMVSTIAANGEGGLSSWAISGPQGLAFDIYGNLYVQQIYGQLLKISSKGVVSTIDVPGLITGFQTGVTTDKNGNVYLTINPAENLDFIYKISPDGQAVLLAGGQAGYKDSIGIYAQFEYAIGITADKHGNLFVADEGNHRIRKLGKSLSEFSALSGTPSTEQRFSVSAVNLRGDAILTASGGFELSLTQGGSYSSSLSLSPVNGEINLAPVYIRMQASSAGSLSGSITLSSDGAETQSLSVKGKVLQPALLFDPVVVSTVAGTGEAGFSNGSATTAKFNSPLDVARDVAGNIYVADANNNRIRKITPAGVVSTFAGSGIAGNTNGSASTARFNHPHGVAVDASGNVYVGDEGNNLIRKITPTGIVSTFAGSGANGFSDGMGTAAQFSGPEDIIVDPAGNFYVVDGGNHAIRKITPAGQVITIAGDGVAGTDDGQGPNARFYYPKSVALDPYGNLWVTELYGQLRKISASGMVSTVITSEFIFGFRFGVVSDSAANIYVGDVIDNTQNYIYKVTPGGTGALVAGGVNGFKDSIGAEARFSFPEGLAIDGSGNLYVADNGNNRIRKISVPRLNFLATAGTPSVEQMFRISGVNLEGNVGLTVPSAYEVSLTSG
ncbi:MAG TPA: hypothetical protein VFS31_09530, partial [Chitinophagaceae bacterium]|nr:hypothetical protein [Chitinophagaceae bacterium]